jgi:hypothetical protein
VLCLPQVWLWLVDYKKSVNKKPEKKRLFDLLIRGGGTVEVGRSLSLTVYAFLGFGTHRYVGSRLLGFGPW